jgi:hypothetical protein
MLLLLGLLEFARNDLKNLYWFALYSFPDGYGSHPEYGGKAGIFNGQQPLSSSHLLCSSM